IGGWTVSSVTNMQSMFSFATAFNQDIGGWNVSSVTHMRNMFSFATAFNQDIGGWNVSNVTRTSSMFNGATAFNQDIGEWILSSDLTSLSNMFEGATAFNQDISGWDVSQVENFTAIFEDATAFDQNLGQWEIVSANSQGFNGAMQNMFDNSGMSAPNLTNTIIGWSNLEADTPQNIGLGVEGLEFCQDNLLYTFARVNLANNNGWTFLGNDNFVGVDCN
ncbi:MAG: BspA family leucine-rich repeat surface protein, partial [Bacteroidota bacterium]